MRLANFSFAPNVDGSRGGKAIIASRRNAMPTCENCGNDYANTFEVKWNSEVHVFDSFECAIHALAPA